MQVALEMSAKTFSFAMGKLLSLNQLSLEVHKIGCEELRLKPLLAELVEFDFTRKVLSDEILDLLAHRWLEVVLVDVVEVLDLVVVDLGGTGEEPRNVLLEHGESRVQILQHANY